MTPSELKYNIEQTGEQPYYFTRQTMRFFGDTMKNYGVRSAIIDGRHCWELYRKRTVKHGLKTSAYFDKETFIRIHPAR